MSKVLAIARQRITEQFNIVTIFFTVAVSAVLYGWIEGTLYPYYPFKQQFSVFGHFTWYHVVFCLLFFVIAFSFSLSRVMILGRRVYYLLFASLGSVAWGFWIEDMSYFATRYPLEKLVPGVWVEWGLSGFYFAGHWIPRIYVLLCFGGFCLFGAAFLVARRDIMAFGLQTRPMFGQRMKLLALHASLTIAFALLAQVSNLTASSLTDLNIALSVLERLISIATVVIAFPLALLVTMDHLSSTLSPKVS